jgi:hypothetical protein
MISNNSSVSNIPVAVKPSFLKNGHDFSLEKRAHPEYYAQLSILTRALPEIFAGRGLKCANPEKAGKPYV